MIRFIIIDGLPYLFAHDKAYKVRLNEKGLVVGAEIPMDSAPTKTYSETSIRAKCAGNLDSIGTDEAPKKATGTRRKKSASE